MLKGYYTLASGMLSNSRNLNVIGNNMTNLSTPGFKKDTLMTSAFQTEMLYRIDSKRQAAPVPLGNVTMLNTVDETATDYTQGALDETGNPFDFALLQEGFFQIQTEDGPVYTRNGAFTLDDQGYLTLQHVGRVQGENGPIYLGVDNFTADTSGNLYFANGMIAGKIAVVTFPPDTALVKTGEGMFTGEGGVAAQNPAMQWKATEHSNVDPLTEMTDMMTNQRALQSASQMLKIYDQLMGKIVETGRV